MKRRNFLKLSATASVIGLTPFEIQATLKPLMSLIDCPDISNRKLILINLSGGNDGLNSIIPLNQYDLYKKLRPTIGVSNTGNNPYIKLDTSLPDNQQIGLNPALSSFKSMYDNGTLRIIQSVGYPSQNKSHFKSGDLYQTGNDGKSLNNGKDSGWTGRFMEQFYADKIEESYPLAVELGSFQTSLGFHGHIEHNLSLNITGQDPAGYYSILNGLGGAPPQNIPDSDFGKELDFIIKTDALSNKYAASISDAFNKGQNAISYPDTDISNQLKTIAKLISGDLKSKVYMVRIGGFDTHNTQTQDAGSPIGKHFNLLTQLSEGIDAFTNDLNQQNLAEDIVGLTFSEFGRKAAENGNLGTDHGEIAPMFVFGKPIEGGVSGTNPNLNEATDDNNYQLKTVQYDYRETFGTLLKDYLGAPEMIIDATFFNHTSNESFYNNTISNLIKDQYNISKSCIKDIIPGLNDNQKWQVYPNPFNDLVKLNSINQEEYVQFELFTATGALIMSQREKTSFGKYAIYLAHLSSGPYLLKIISNEETEVHKIIKI